MVRLVFVGDVMVTEPLPTSGSALQTFFLLQKAELAFGNLEAPLSRRGSPTEKLINFRADPDRSIDLQRIGFRLMSVANNHILDFGPEAFFDTLSILQKNGIASVGAGKNHQQAWSPVIQTLNGIQLAFVSASSTLPPGFAALKDRPGVAPIRVTETIEVNPIVSMEQPGTAPYVHTSAWTEDVETAQSIIAQVKNKADFVVFSIHWGVPPPWRAQFQEELAEYQRPLGRAFIEAGADLVVGHHPHSLQEIEVYQGKPIFYSLGNFIFHAHHDFGVSAMARNTPYKLSFSPDREWAESIILDVNVRAGGAVNYELWPILLDETGNPHLLEGEEAQTIIDRLAEMSLYLEGRLTFKEGRGRLAL